MNSAAMANKGDGREALYRFLHGASRQAGPFVAVCALDGLRGAASKGVTTFDGTPSTTALEEGPGGPLLPVRRAERQEAPAFAFQAVGRSWIPKRARRPLSLEAS